MRFSSRRYIAEILPIQHKNQQITCLTLTIKFDLLAGGIFLGENASISSLIRIHNFSLNQSPQIKVSHIRQIAIKHIYASIVFL